MCCILEFNAGSNHQMLIANDISVWKWRRKHAMHPCNSHFAVHCLRLHKSRCSMSFCCSVFGRPSVKRFVLCYRTVVLSVMSAMSCLSVTLVYCGHTVGRIKMILGMQLRLKRSTTLSHFSAHFLLCQMARWIKMPLGTDYGERSRPGATLC